MPITKSDLDRFHEFASRRIGQGRSDLDLDDLIAEWDSAQHRDEINAAIREGLDDIAAGRTRPAEEFTDELQFRLGIKG